MKGFHNNGGNRNKILRVIITFFLISTLLLVLSGCDNRSPKIHKLMYDYLHERYGMEFVVGQLRAAGDIASAGCEAKAYPKGQPHLEFEVDYQNNCFRGEIKKDQLRDNFLSKRWSYQGKLEIEKKIREVYGDSAEFVVEYDIGGGDYKDRDLGYWQMMEQIRGTSGVAERLYYTVFVDGENFNKEKEAGKAYQILKTFVLDYGFTDPAFIVTFIDKVDKQDYLAASKKYEDQLFRNLSEQKGFRHEYRPPNQPKILGCFMLRPLIKLDVGDQMYRKIKSGKDIIKYSKYKN
jgi:hypothetical protein